MRTKDWAIVAWVLVYCFVGFGLLHMNQWQYWAGFVFAVGWLCISHLMES